MTEYEAIVIGAGPAGSTAAREIASRGHSVLLLDRASFPRDKPCGGGVTVRCAALFPFDITHVVEHVVTGAILSAPNAPVVTREAHAPLTYKTQRRRLDAFLVERAQEAGVEFRDAHAVRTITERADGVFEVRAANGDTHTARALIGADGANGVVGTFLGFEHPADAAVALEGNLRFPDGIPQWLHGRVALSLGLMPGGYGWLFPKGDHINVGVGGWKHVAGPRLRAALDAYTRSYGWNPDDLDAVRGHNLPMLRAGVVLTARGVALIGDAAGLVDPLSGEGITAAVASGLAVSSPASDYLRGVTPDMRGYQLALEREVIPDLVASRGLMEVFHAYPAPFVWAAQHSGRVWRAMCGAISGGKGYDAIVQSTGPLAPTLAPLAKVARRLTVAKYGPR